MKVNSDKNLARIYRICLICICSFLGFSATALAQTYWIIENPSRLILYNHYEQRLSEAEKAQLPVFASWEILSEDQHLSDQFTTVVKASCQKKIFFIQTSATGEVLNADQAGKIEVLKNVTIIGDTVRITKSNKIISLIDGEAQQLNEGTLLNLQFKHQTRYYALDLNTGRSGWINPENEKIWEKWQTRPQATGLDVKIFHQVEQTFNRYNQRLGNLFTYLNSKYKTTHPLPYWSVEKSAGSLRYHIEPPLYHNRFNDTQYFIIQEIRDLLHGSIYQVTEEKNQIIISKKLN